jgi:predicted RNA-binding protein with PIN domain
MYLIDGHNLIPKIRGLTLKQADDEQALIEVLQNYKRLSRKKMEVYFDGAPIDQAGPRKMGGIQTYFIKKGQTADDAIVSRLRKMGNRAKQLIVVTSDRRIIREVQAVHASVITSVEFAKQIEKTLSASPSGGKPDPSGMSETELDNWLNLFNKKSG